MKPIIITGLDISSSKISAVMLEITHTGFTTVLGYESQASKGVFRGAITDITEASNSVSRVLAALNTRTMKRPENICVNITGETLKGERSRGMVPISYRGREITRSDIAKCINAASTIRLALDREVIHKIVMNFFIDDQPSMKNPLGLYASRLSCEMYMITGSINHIQNIYKCVDNAGYNVRDIMYSGIADGVSLLEDEWKEEGVMLLNIGASLTELSIFFKGALSAIDIIPIGANDIKGDLKENAVFNEAVSRIKSAADEFIKKDGAVKSVVAAGGFALTEGVLEILEERLSYPVRMGIVKNVQGNISSIDSLRGATAIGLARAAGIEYQPKPYQPRRLVQTISDKVVEIFNNYF